MRPIVWASSLAFLRRPSSPKPTAERLPARLNVGRRFQVRESRYLEVRAEFFNAFNRLGLSNPSSGNPTQTTTYSNGLLSGGYGYINANGIQGQRNGQLVARFQF